MVKMKRVCLILAAVLACLLSCSKKGGRMIPADDLAAMYADMLIVDQWVRNNVSTTRSADTSLVYEPIIRRHGYTRDDYIHTVEAYLRKPGAFAEVFDKTRDLLQERSDFLTAIDDYRNKVEARTDFRRAPVFAVTGEPTLSVRIELDSLGVYSLERMQPDTVYERLIRIVRDSLLRDSTVVAADSLAASDSLTVADSLAVTDSVAPKAQTGAPRPAQTLKKKDKILLNEENSGKILVPAE